MRALLTASFLAVLAAGCGSSGDGPARLPGDVAERLAAQSESIARRLEDGETCRADAEADLLVADVDAAIRDGSVAGPFRAELRRSARSLAAATECVEPAPTPTPTPTPAPPPPDDDEDEGDDD